MSYPVTFAAAIAAILATDASGWHLHGELAPLGH